MEKLLFKTALFVSIAGLILLFVFSSAAEIKEIKISEISRENLEEKIKTKGTVTEFIQKKNVNFIEIDNSSLQVVYFDEIELKKGDSIEVIGQVKLYKGKLEVVADEIKKIS